LGKEVAEVVADVAVDMDGRLILEGALRPDSFDIDVLDALVILPFSLPFTLLEAIFDILKQSKISVNVKTLFLFVQS
jgi:hypothetical protein